MEDKGPIGVFDSGYGGLTILSEFKKELSEHDYLYLGDNARAPYGNRSYDVVYDFTLEAVKFLKNKGCRLVIVACNTASAKALRTIQQQDLIEMDSDFRVLGVIRPTTETIGELSETKHVGILGTEGTVNSNSYRIELKKFSPNLIVNQQACPMWVPLIESNKHLSESGKAIIKEDFFELLSKDPSIDTVLLACTHYPIIASYLQELSKDKVRIISQGPIVAKKLKDYLQRHELMNKKLSRNGTCVFLTTENHDVFNKSAESFMSMNVNAQQIKL
ncbi:MAG: glutamate racemase [Flavobacteriales bacterium]|nr:glutamate racemase [Flavobacteriales bacterium]